MAASPPRARRRRIAARRFGPRRAPRIVVAEVFANSAAVACRSLGDLASARARPALIPAGSAPRSARKRRRLGQVLHHDRLHRRSAERRLAGRASRRARNRGSTCRVRASSLAPRGLLRAHVCRACRSRCRCRSVLGAGGRGRAGDAEVRHQRAAVAGEQDVLRLHVTMDHALLVSVLQRRARPRARSGRASAAGAAPSRRSRSPQRFALDRRAW